ncbi:phosphate/phosphite/phosphonate ABC transporter substrate-binding protein [Alkalihalobacillus sp. BA299]|uniref:phosphate/phosphite/phosphonate ABC transporter substrate-binding protein n=1 Tax=Alkalihalobacillus sp. BA299 TaxID=2815938 RepID=UPI001ADAA6FA|nr:phosphate/phosphite/phosphonate ABC transporter substrate-binding protein [Alkalihalobacillus sp. BA299]
MKITFRLLIVVLWFVTAGCNQEQTLKENEVFTIGLIPSQTEGEMQTAIDKLQALLSKELNRKVEITHYPAYNAVVEALNYSHIDMAFFGPLTYVIAHERSGAEAIITQLVDGEPYYYSYIITHVDSKWETLDELLEDHDNVDFAFGSLSSTSGSLIPSVELKNRGVYTSEDNHKFNSITFTGSHDVTGQSVLNKYVDAGAIDSAIFYSLVKSGKLNGEKIKVIWKSEKLFQYPWAVSPETGAETIVQLQDIFMGITDEEILSPFGASGFTTASNEDYASLREAAIIDGRLDDDLD